MPDRIHIDVYIASQKMFSLRIIGVTEHLLDKNLSTTCGGEEPKKKAQQECEQQGPGNGRETQRKPIIF